MLVNVGGLTYFHLYLFISDLYSCLIIDRFLKLKLLKNTKIIIYSPTKSTNVVSLESFAPTKRRYELVK